MYNFRKIDEGANRVYSSDDISAQINLVTAQMSDVIAFATKYKVEKQEVKNIRSYERALRAEPTNDAEQKKQEVIRTKLENAQSLRYVVKKKKDSLVTLRRKLKELMKATKT